ncbi:MAG TPA: DUF3800 domain-containing protein [Vicinamibacterales bacterium]
MRGLSAGADDAKLGFVMAITLYVDESESQTPAVFTLAGFAASPVGWRDFIPAWREMLCSIGPYPVDAFHANRIDKGEPPFDGWKPEERAALFARAVDILADTQITSNLYAIGCSFVIDDMLANLPSCLGDKSTPDIYERCYRVLFYNILKFSPFMGVDFVFDKKKKSEHKVKGHFDRVKETSKRDSAMVGTLGECAFEDDRKVMPLQAADLLAFELRRRAWDRKRNDSLPIRRTYQRLKDVFKKTSVDARPPYRQRIFRCYDNTFIKNLLTEVAKPEHQPITEGDVTYLWYHMDAPED